MFELSTILSPTGFRRVSLVRVICLRHVVRETQLQPLPRRGVGKVIEARAEASPACAAPTNARVASKDVQTEFVSVDPRYDDGGRTITATRRRTRYRRSSASSRRWEDVIDAAVAAGANNAARDSATPSEPGSAEITASVRVVFSIS